MQGVYIRINKYVFRMAGYTYAVDRSLESDTGECDAVLPAWLRWRGSDQGSWSWLPRVCAFTDSPSPASSSVLPPVDPVASGGGRLDYAAARMHDAETIVEKQRETGWTGLFRLDFDPRKLRYTGHEPGIV